MALVSVATARSIPRRHSWSKILLFFSAALLFVFFCLPSGISLENESALAAKTSTPDTQGKSLSSSSSSSSSPRLVREQIGNVDVLWQAPIQDPRQACGILFVAHGCHHSATDFWSGDNSKEQDEGACGPECLGLPEERAIVQLALARNLIVVAVSSQNRISGCWSPTKDNPIVTHVLLTLQQRWKSAKHDDDDSTLLPIFSFGASSGGHMVGQLDVAMAAAGGRLDAIVSQIAAPIVSPQSSTGCAVYLTMNRDTRVDASVVQALASLEHGTSKTIATKHIRLPPLELNDSFFADRINNSSFFTPALSQKMVSALRAAGYLEETQEFLRQDPRRSDWRHVLRPLVPETIDSFVADQSPVSEVLNVAFGKHEMSRDGVAQALEFCSMNAVAMPRKTCRW